MLPWTACSPSLLRLARPPGHAVIVLNRNACHHAAETAAALLAGGGRVTARRVHRGR
jgi:hypothetical protein